MMNDENDGGFTQPHLDVDEDPPNRWKTNNKRSVITHSQPQGPKGRNMGRWPVIDHNTLTGLCHIDDPALMRRGRMAEIPPNKNKNKVASGLRSNTVALMNWTSSISSWSSISRRLSSIHSIFEFLFMVHSSAHGFHCDASLFSAFWYATKIDGHTFNDSIKLDGAKLGLCDSHIYGILQFIAGYLSCFFS